VNNSLRSALSPVHHGIAMGLLALICGGVWAGYIATHHESLHGGFEAAEASIKQAQAKAAMADMDMNAMSMAHEHDAGSADHHDEPAPSSHGGEGHHAGGGHGHANGEQHSHSGSLATDAMQRLLRGHIHFMGIGLLAILMLVLVASTSLKPCWKKVFGWTFGLGALMYPPAWILMGFRTVELGPQAAEASVLWLFGPAVGLLIGSLIALFVVLAMECTRLRNSSAFGWAFEGKD